MNNQTGKLINEMNVTRKKEVSEMGPVPKVTIQGFEGSFHQEAARRFFGKNV